MKILMVCLGNICRSPLAEGILKEKARRQGLEWTVDSAGTGSWHIGEPPDHRSIEVARINDIDITDQRARQFKSEDWEQYDHILAMDENNYRDILARKPSDAPRAKLALILDFAPEYGLKNIPDPYWDDHGFEHVFRLLDAACQELLNALVEDPDSSSA